MRSDILVVGHLPPPVTGENLCRAHLEAMWQVQGHAVVSRRAHALANFTSCRRVIWLFAGASRSGYLRDMVLLNSWRLTGCRVFIYIHNQSWSYYLLHATWWRRIGGGHFHFVVLTDAIAAKFHSAGLRATRLNNTLPQGPEPTGPVAGEAEKRLIWMGAVTAEKGFDTACAVFAELYQRDSTWRFDVYGLGPLADAVRDLDGAFYHGFADAETKAKAWGQGGIFILPSRYVNETQPLAIIEALANGIPFLACPVGGIAVMRGDENDPAGDCLRTEQGVSAWASAAEALLSNYSERSAAARRTYERDFSRAAYAAGVDALMKQVG